MSCLLHVQEYMYEVTQIVINSTCYNALAFFRKGIIAEHLLQRACRAFSKGFFRCDFRFKECIHGKPKFCTEWMKILPFIISSVSRGDTQAKHSDS